MGCSRSEDNCCAFSNILCILTRMPGTKPFSMIHSTGLACLTKVISCSMRHHTIFVHCSRNLECASVEVSSWAGCSKAMHQHFTTQQLSQVPRVVSMHDTSSKHDILQRAKPQTPHQMSDPEAPCRRQARQAPVVIAVPNAHYIAVSTRHRFAFRANPRSETALLGSIETLAMPHTFNPFRGFVYPH